MGGMSGDDPVAITKRRALMRWSPASSVSRVMKCPLALITLTPRPANLSTESFGAIAAMTPWTWSQTAAASIDGSTGRMPKAAAERMRCARRAAASSAFDGTQP